MTTEQEIDYTNRSCGIVTDLHLRSQEDEINYSNLMSHIHAIEDLVRYCGRFSLTMRSREEED